MDKKFPISPLGRLEEAFLSLAVRKPALTLDGSDFGDPLPPGPTSLLELRVLLLRRSTPFHIRDAVIGELVRRASWDEDWAVAVAGLLLPGLRRVAGKLTRRYPADTHCVDAAVIAGFFDALKTCDPNRSRIAAALVWAACRRGHELSRGDREYAAHTVEADVEIGPVPLADHPDLVLARAVGERVISAVDAELIAATRLAHLSFESCAEQLDTTVGALRRRRSRAERKLVPYLRTQIREACPISG